MAVAKLVMFFGDPTLFMCDANCNKAWGINTRPRVELSDDPDDYEYLADSELGDAPTDPGTYEGSDGKPRTPEQRMNRWCVRECERSVMGELGELVEARDLSKRLSNMPKNE